MSYCHLCGGMTNINMNFHPRAITQIQVTLTAVACCVVGCAAAWQRPVLVLSWRLRLPRLALPLLARNPRLSGPSAAGKRQMCRLLPRRILLSERSDCPSHRMRGWPLLSSWQRCTNLLPCRHLHQCQQPDARGAVLANPAGLLQPCRLICPNTLFCWLLRYF